MNDILGNKTDPVRVLLTNVRIRGFRTLRDASFSPGPLSALIGEPGTGKSNLLAAIHTALQPTASPLTADDIARTGGTSIRIEVETAAGGGVTLEGTPPTTSQSQHGEVPLVLYLPARLRAGPIVATETVPGPGASLALELQTIRSGQGSGQSSYPPGTTEAARGLVDAVEAWIQNGLTGLVLLIEEPELYLPPQIQRYLYRLLRRLADLGNQVLYSTHSPSFLNVAHLDELVFTEHDQAAGTRLVQPKPLPTDQEFRAYSEFDATRSELFLARAAILVEGQTERLALPFVFQALGYDPDQERISIVECGGKSNIPLIAQVCKAVGVPFLAVHDRDAPQGRKPSRAEQRLNQLIGQIAGANRVELTPDFEAVAGLRGRRHKPARAWRHLATLEPEAIPRPLSQLAQRAIALARPDGAAQSLTES